MPVWEVVGGQRMHSGFLAERRTLNRLLSFIDNHCWLLFCLKMAKEQPSEPPVSVTGCCHAPVPRTDWGDPPPPPPPGLFNTSKGGGYIFLLCSFSLLFNISLILLSYCKLNFPPVKSIKILSYIKPPCPLIIHQLPLWHRLWSLVWAFDFMNFGFWRNNVAILCKKIFYWTKSMNQFKGNFFNHDNGFCYMRRSERKIGSQVTMSWAIVAVDACTCLQDEATHKHTWQTWIYCIFFLFFFLNVFWVSI